MNRVVSSTTVWGPKRSQFLTGAGCWGLCFFREKEIPGSGPSSREYACISFNNSRNCINTRKSWGLYSRAPASEYLRSHHAAGSVCFCHPPGWVVAAETPAPAAHRPVVCRVGALGPRLPYKRKHISAAASLRTLLPSAL